MTMIVVIKLTSSITSPIKFVSDQDHGTKSRSHLNNYIIPPLKPRVLERFPSSVDGYLSSSMKDPFCHSTPPYRTPPPTTALFGYFRFTHLVQPNEGYTIPKSTVFNSSKSGSDRLLPRRLEKSFRTRILVIISMFFSSVQTGIL